MKHISNLFAVTLVACSLVAVSSSEAVAFDTVLAAGASGSSSFPSAQAAVRYRPVSSESFAFPNYFSGAGKEYASLSAAKRGVYPRKTARRVRGTGFYVAPNMVLTNAHVVKSCGKIIVNDMPGGNGARVVAIDKDTDLAVVRTDVASGKWAAISRGDIDKGDDLIVAGYPTEGRVSAEYERFASKAATAGFGENAERFHFSGNVKKGNSGGPVLNAQGDVAGVVVGRVKLMFASADNGAFSSMKSSGVAISAESVRNFMARKGVQNPACAGGGCKARDPKEFVAKLACIK